MKISLVIPVYNEEAIIEPCLKAVFSQTEAFDEVILVDNNCTDKSMKIAKKYPVKIVKEKQQGISYARNKGFNSAKYDIIGRIDCDTVLPPDWAKKVKQTFKAHPEYLAITGPIFFHDLAIKHLASPIHSAIYYHLLKKIHGFYFVIGCNMALRQSAWHKIKNLVIMDNKEVHEDLDLAVQVAKFGQIGYIRAISANISGRRLRKFPGNLEYLTRYLKMASRLLIFKNYQDFQ